MKVKIRQHLFLACVDRIPGDTAAEQYLDFLEKRIFMIFEDHFFYIQQDSTKNLTPSSHKSLLFGEQESLTP
jgi:hypothetical protein